MRSRLTKAARLARLQHGVIRRDQLLAVGYNDNAIDGAVQRGILEPGTQYVVFTLPVGSTSEILDTPRGFWIVKRLK